MNVAQMRARERYSDILLTTLATHWTRAREAPTQVTAGWHGAGQRWLFHPVCNAYFTERVGAAAARFLMDGIRFTPRARRALPQFLLGTALGHPAVLRATARRAFRVEPALDDDGRRVVVPGNQRLREFDLVERRCSVVLKDGFDAATMQREVRLRTSARAQAQAWIPDVLEHDLEGGWFVEPMLDGVALPRCAPWRPRRRYAQVALELLQRWLDGSRETRDASGYAQQLRDQLVQAATAVAARWPDQVPLPRVVAWADRLAEETALAGTLEVAEGHGDLQPGNIMVSPAGDVSVIDWEHAGVRSVGYDRLVYTLQSRGGGRLGARIRRFAAAEDAGGGAAWLAPPARRTALAVFLLEDLAWFAAESLSGPFLAPSAGFVGYLGELEQFGPRLEGLLGGAAR